MIHNVCTSCMYVLYVVYVCLFTFYVMCIPHVYVLSVRVYICMHVKIVCMHACIHAYRFACMHECTHACMYSIWQLGAGGRRHRHLHECCARSSMYAHFMLSCTDLHLYLLGVCVIYLTCTRHVRPSILMRVNMHGQLSAGEK